MRATVVVLTKLPERLPVKTRLVPVLGEEGARAFYLEMLHETLRLVPEAIVAYSPPDAETDLPNARPVEGDDGATCLENALADAYEGKPLVALGGDAPDLPRARIEQAVAALHEYDAAFVPTPDGGFSCLALRVPVEGLAAGFTYGEGDALVRLRAFLADRGLSSTCLEPWPDIDTPEDLAAYRNRRTKSVLEAIQAAVDLAHEHKTRDPQFARIMDFHIGQLGGLRTRVEAKWPPTEQTKKFANGYAALSARDLAGGAADDLFGVIAELCGDIRRS